VFSFNGSQRIANRHLAGIKIKTLMTLNISVTVVINQNTLFQQQQAVNKRVL
jgi:hypothetical protein